MNGTHIRFILFVSLVTWIVFVGTPTQFDASTSSDGFEIAQRDQNKTLRHLRFLGQRCGYNNIAFNPETRAFEIAKHKIQNELFLHPVGAGRRRFPDSLLVGSINNVLFQLDDAITAHLTFHEISHRRGKPGMGRTGRGWGITSPFSNKWKYYVTHLLAVKAKYVCEVGFLAGHSAGVFVGAMRHANLTIKAFNEFDMIQPGTSWHEPAINFFKREFGPQKFFMHEGKS
eukprot:PhF_6_TR31545/c0_g2_i7/m.46560